MEILSSPIINSILLTLVMFTVGNDPAIGQSSATPTKSENKTQIVRGQSGGSIDSKGCGFIADAPNHTFLLSQRVDYMRLSLKAAGGQPTLLVLGPNAGDSFCILGDRGTGLKPEISGVWEAGEYQIYVGDRIGQNYQFTLDISTENP